MDSDFSASYVLSSDAIISQDAVVNNYGESEEIGVWSDHTLTVSNLPKYDVSGQEWLYYVTETEVLNASGEDMSGKYQQEYRDKNHYKASGDFTYSGGSVTNIRTSITISKTVSGNMGDKTKLFRFTLTLSDGDSNFQETVAYLKGTESGSVTFSDGTAQLTLKHGEWVTLLDLPKNLSYTVMENEEDAAGYETSVTMNGTNAGAVRAVSGTLANNPVVAFANRREVAIPTGIRSDIHAWLCVAFLSGLLPLSLCIYRALRRRPSLTGGQRR